MNARLELVPTSTESRPSTTSSTSKRLFLDGVSKRFGGVTALQHMSLEVEPGALVALLGPSGCGKTTTLRIIAGFELPDTGMVCIDREDISHLPPNKRGLGMVFQNYGLFPHLNVGENIAFGLRMSGMLKRERADHVKRMLDVIRLPGIAERRIAQLSGGQQQRVALARALITNPSVLLLDEPLGALDKNLREGMQFELRQLQRRLGITSVMVTHDQEEALTMSDRVVVMNQGRILQTGTPAEVYNRPRTRFVAEFLGTANVIACDVIEANPQQIKLKVQADSSGEDIQFMTKAATHVRGLGRVEIAVRPEKLALDTPRANHVQMDGIVIEHVFRGAHHAYLLELSAINRRVYAYQQVSSGSGQPIYAAGAIVVASFDPADAVILEADEAD
jgi:spermidine/putrescine ABC transporter ATP-binding subunit